MPSRLRRVPRRRRRNWRAPSPRDWRASRSGATARSAADAHTRARAPWRPFAFPCRFRGMRGARESRGANIAAAIRFPAQSAAAASCSDFSPVRNARAPSARDVLDSIPRRRRNGDALLCEYSVCLTLKHTTHPRSRARARAVCGCSRGGGPEERAEADDARSENEKQTRQTVRDGSPDDHAGRAARPRTLGRGRPPERINERVHGIQSPFREEVTGDA